MSARRPDHDDPGPPSLMLDLTFASTPECQSDARHQLEQWLVAQGVARACVADVVLGASEALSNVVRHAYREQVAPGEMTMTAHLTASAVVITDRKSTR